jgi:hypothetical protein
MDEINICGVQFYYFSLHFICVFILHMVNYLYFVWMKFLFVTFYYFGYMYFLEFVLHVTRTCTSLYRIIVLFVTTCTSYKIIVFWMILFNPYL